MRIKISVFQVFICLAACDCTCRSSPAGRGTADAGAATGTVVIVTYPPGAAVFEHQRLRLGRTPLTLERPAGRVLNLLLVKEGYERKPLDVTVVGGTKREVDARLQPARAKLVVEAGPLRGVEISLDGEVVGRTPQRLTITAGVEHLVELSMTGFYPYQERVTVEAGGSERINAVMLPLGAKKVAPGWLTVEVDTPAEVFLDGTSLGQAPLRRVPLPPKRYRLRAVSSTLGRSREQSVVLTAHQVEKVQLRLLEEAPDKQ